jgi:chromate reductase, NAD(P)H dehydrogenase (quinone)
MSKVITICGSLRKDSFNRKLAALLPSLAPAGMTITASPSIEMPLYNADIQAQGIPAPVTALADAVRAADGVIVVTPEYNFTIPGGLKNAFDWISRLKEQPFVGKPVAIQSASGGPVGGARMQYDLRKMMVYLDAVTLNKPEIFVGMAQTKFDEKTGELKDDVTRNFVKQQLEAFGTFIARMSGT